MKIRTALAWLSLGWACLLPLPTAAAAEPVGSVRLRRFALLVGVNDDPNCAAVVRISIIALETWLAASRCWSVARMLSSRTSAVERISSPTPRA